MDLAGRAFLVQTTNLCEIKGSMLSRHLAATHQGIFVIYLTFLH